MVFTDAQIAQRIGVSALGLYAGLLTANTAISALAPLDAVKGKLIHTHHGMSMVNSLVGTISTVGFGLAYFWTPEHLRKKCLLCGMLAGPISVGFLFLTGMVCGRGCCCFGMGKSCKRGDGEKAELPEGHPEVPEGDEAKCPYAKMVNAKDGKCPHGPCGCPVCSPRTLRMLVATAAVTFIFVRNVFLL